MTAERRGEKGLARWLSVALLGVFLAGVFVPPTLARAPVSVRVLAGHEEELGVAPTMLYDYLVRLAREEKARSLEKKSRFRSPADWEGWQRYVRKKIREMIGPFPPRNPLNVRRVGQISTRWYRIEKLIYESRPQFFVTANLYVPTQGDPPFPGALIPCGHSRNGKAAESYQRVAALLAQNGFVVLIYDPLGQGERSEYVDPKTGQNVLAIGTRQHCQAGNQCYLTGTNLAQYRIWDGVRGIDLLRSLPEVDSTRIAVTGNSGGGTLTTYITAVDSRVAVSVPSCYITTLVARIESHVTADAEQNFVNSLAYGIDHGDLLMPHAPKPLMIAAARRDFFPFNGTLDTFGELQRTYSDFGVPEKVSLVQADDEHGFSKPRREMAVAWISRWLKGNTGHWHEGKIAVQPDSALQCTPTGQVQTSLGGTTVWEMNLALAESLASRFPPVPSADFPAWQEKIRLGLRKLLGLPDADQPVEVRELGSVPVRGVGEAQALAFRTEPGIWVPAVLIPGPQTSLPGKILVAIGDHGKENVERSGSLARLAHEAGWTVLAIDPRGMGETRVPGRNGKEDRHYFDYYGQETDFTYNSFILGRPLTGQRVYDVLQVLAGLRLRQPKTQLWLAGRGYGGLIALLAAALDTRVAGAVVDSVLGDYMSLVRDRLYDYHVRWFIPGILQHFDLPWIAAAVAPRPLRLCRLLDSRGRPLGQAEAAGAYRITKRGFEQAGAGTAFTLSQKVVDSAVLRELR